MNIHAQTAKHDQPEKTLAKTRIMQYFNTVKRLTDNTPGDSQHGYK